MSDPVVDVTARSRILARKVRNAALYPWFTKARKLDDELKLEMLEVAEKAKSASEPESAKRALSELEEAVSRNMFPGAGNAPHGQLRLLAHRVAEAEAALSERKDRLGKRGAERLNRLIKAAELARGRAVTETAEELDKALDDLLGDARPSSTDVDKMGRKLLSKARRLLASKRATAALDHDEIRALSEAADHLEELLASGASGSAKGKALRALQDLLDSSGWKAELGRRTVREARRLAKEAARLLRKKRVRLALGPEHSGAVRQALDKVTAALKKAGVLAALKSLHGGKALQEYSAALREVQEASDELDDLVKRHMGLFLKSELREYVESIGGAILIALAIRAFLFEPFRIPSGSMLPTLEIGDHIFVNKYQYGIRIPFMNAKLFYEDKLPERGDVIVFVQPETGEDYIKRVIGLPGDVVEVRGGTHLFINGEQVPIREKGVYEYEDRKSGWRHKTLLYDEDLLGRVHDVIYEPAYHRHGPSGRWVVKPGHVLVMGDNRDNSYDSRSWGQVPLENIKGRAVVIWFAWSRWERYGMKVK